MRQRYVRLGSEPVLSTFDSNKVSSKCVPHTVTLNSRPGANKIVAQRNRKAQVCIACFQAYNVVVEVFALRNRSL